MQLDLSTPDGRDNFNKILQQDPEDTIKISGKDVSVKDLLFTKEDPKFETKPEIGERIFTVYDANGRATGEQLDLSNEDDLERYKKLLADPKFTVAKISINAADSNTLASNVSKTYNTDLKVNMDSAS